MQPVSLSVESAPPTREHPGRCADRWSPNALPLFDVASARVVASPREFPIRETVGIVVVSAIPLVDGDGYGANDPIIEVLVDAGLFADERQVMWERSELEPT